MSEYVVKAGATATLGRVDGDLRSGKGATIKAESGRKVVVMGNTFFEGPVRIDCEFECQSMRVQGRGYGPSEDVAIRGNLTVHGRADIDASVKVDGEIKSEDFDVGGHLKSESLVSKRVRVGGHMDIEGGLEADTVEVGGHMTVSGAVHLVNLRVGGYAKVGGGVISGEISIRGHLISANKLAYGNLKVFGHMRLPADSSGERLSALGKVEFEGDAVFKEMEVNGVAKVRGNCDAEHVEVNGKFVVSGSLRVSKRFDVYGVADVNREISCDNLEVEGKLAADIIRISDQAQIVGEVETSQGLKARAIQVGKGSKVKGPLVGEQIELAKEIELKGGIFGQVWKWKSIKRMTKVEDVHGKIVTIGSNSQARHVFGEVVQIEEGGMAEDVTYTKEVRLPKQYHLDKPPLKAARLPDPPI
jgi:cytoskeletal protein CcmA (bactofilin family)